MRILKGLFTALIAVSAVAVATPTLADSTVNSSPGGSRVRWFSYGDRMEVTDVAADGFSAYGRWAAPASGQGAVLWDASGANDGNYQSVSYSSALQEGTSVLITSCRGYKSTGHTQNCVSQWDTTTNP